MNRPTLAIAAIAATLFAVVMMCARPAQAADKLVPNVQDGGCFVPGDDAGSLAVAPVAGGTQFMVTTNFAINYRACKPGACVATATDAPIPVTTAGEDLCQPTGFSQVAFFKVYDAGNPAVCVYAVNPKTICQLNTP